MYGLEVLMAALLMADGKLPFSGAQAFEMTRRVVALGERQPGTRAHAQTQAIIRAHLKANGWEVVDDCFTATTPAGAKPMCNIIGRRRGSGGAGAPALVVSGHYDTKVIPGITFVGANDAGSSTGFLLELARVLPKAAWRSELLLVWFDGEESVAQWTDTDSLYGSRHLADRWAADGTLRRIRALINVDMIGDRDLQIMNETSGIEWLRRMIWSTAAELGYSRHFGSWVGWIADDHMPFIRRGVAAVDLIDFEYPPWHTAEDTLDKLDPGSFQVVGDVVCATLRKLDADPAAPRRTP